MPENRLAQELLRPVDGTLHPLLSRRQHDLCAIGRQHCPPFGAHRVRHGQDGFVSAHGGDAGQPDSGVAGSRFNDGASRFEKSPLFSILNHIQCCTVLDRTCRIEAFQFDKDFSVQLFPGGKALRREQRRIADQLTCRMKNHMDTPFVKGLGCITHRMEVSPFWRLYRQYGP